MSLHPIVTPQTADWGGIRTRFPQVSDLISIDEARRRALEAVTRLGDEDVPLDLALDRVLAEDVRSGIEVPPFDSSGMDGYAVIAGPEAELARAIRLRRRCGRARRSGSLQAPWSPRAPTPWFPWSERLH